MAGVNGKTTSSVVLVFVYDRFQLLLVNPLMTLGHHVRTMTQRMQEKVKPK
jgi:hypothetical protein